MEDIKISKLIKQNISSVSNSAQAVIICTFSCGTFNIRNSVVTNNVAV